MQLFPRTLNLLPIAGAVGGGLAPVGLVLGIWYFASPNFTQVGFAPEQPIPYSHRLHVGELGLDCRYCHSNVESSEEAMLPATQMCMGCHNLVATESAALLPLRESWETDESVPWVRVHRLPDHVFFDHSVHVAANVGCKSCHGPVDEMDVVRQTEELSMGWCLDCHRDPSQHLRPDEVAVTDMSWEQSEDLSRVAAMTANVDPPEYCSGCHR